MAQISLTVNGRHVEKDVPDDQILSRFLRETLGLTGVHEGCDTSQCGACVVHIGGRAVKSCTTLAATLDQSEVTTIEGLSPIDGDLHPMQAAFQDNHGLQCGFCTPGMIMSAVGIVERSRESGVALTAETVRDELDGNICRCTGYQNIVQSILDGAGRLTQTGGAEK